MGGTPIPQFGIIPQFDGRDAHPTTGKLKFNVQLECVDFLINGNSPLPITTSRDDNSEGYLEALETRLTPGSNRSKSKSEAILANLARSVGSSKCGKIPNTGI